MHYRVSEKIIDEINKIAVLFHPDFTGKWDWTQANNKTMVIRDDNLTEVQNRLIQILNKYNGEDADANPL